MATESDLRNAVRAEGTALIPAIAEKTWTTPLNLTSAGVRRAWIITNPDPVRWPDGKDDGKPILVSPWSLLQWTWYQLGHALDPRVVPYASQVLSRAVWMRPSGLKDAAGADVPFWVLLRDLAARPTADVDEDALAAALAPLLQDTTDAEAELIAAKFRDAITGGQLVLVAQAPGTQPT